MVRTSYFAFSRVIKVSYIPLLTSLFSLNSCSSIGTSKEQGQNQILRSTVLNYGQVTAACFTGDGQRLLSAIGDNQIRV